MTLCEAAAAIGPLALGLTGEYEQRGSVSVLEILGEGQRGDHCGWEVRCSVVQCVARLQTQHRPLAAKKRMD